MTNYVIDEKGREVISERHQKDFKKEYASQDGEEQKDGDKNEDESTESFTDIRFEDI